MYRRPGLSGLEFEGADLIAQLDAGNGSRGGLILTVGYEWHPLEAKSPWSLALGALQEELELGEAGPDPESCSLSRPSGLAPALLEGKPG